MSDTEIIEWERWPNLRIRHHPQLDWHVPEYEPEKIRQMADAAEQGDWNPWTKSTVDALRALADTPLALKELNQHQDTIPREVLGLNRAVHYLVRLQTEGEDKAEARRKIGINWGAAAATIKEDLVLYGDTAKHIIDELLQGLEAARGKTRAELLEAFDLDMIHRARHMARHTRREK